MKATTPTELFRNDINGLRAYAVIAVILFHFKVAGFNSGFLGVDVFFVISGFLMTSIIVRGLEDGKFSIWKFYMARMRRIAPTLILLISTLLVIGWFLLPTPDYKALGSQSAYASAFISNFFFWRSSGYFDTAAHEKWLLHTWTLGVEAQFYVLLPLFLIFLWKIKSQSKTLLFGFIFSFLASLALSVLISNSLPAAAFYLLPTRGWEFIAGGLVFFAGREYLGLERFSKIFLWTGFSLLLLAFILIDDSYSWPSGWALLPVTATAFIILAKQLTSVLTAHPIAQWLGDRSYSLYLWHWPIVVAMYYFGFQSDPLWISGGLILSIFLGDLSYRYIETKTRIYLSKISTGKELLSIGAALILVVTCAASAKFLVFEGRITPLAELAAAETNNRDLRRFACHKFSLNTGSPGCQYGHGDITAIVVGDSHAHASVSAVAEAGESFHKSVLLHSLDGCRQVFGTTKVKYESVNLCEALNNWVINDLENYPSMPIVIINRSSVDIFGPNDDAEQIARPKVYFSKHYLNSYDSDFLNEYRNAFISSVCNFRKTDRQVYLVRPYPEMTINVPTAVSRNMIIGRDSVDIKITLDEYHKRQNFIWETQDIAAERCGIKILNPLPYLCDEKYCYGSKQGKPLYYDSNHFSENGNKILVPMFKKIFIDQSAIK